MLVLYEYESPHHLLHFYGRWGAVLCALVTLLNFTSILEIGRRQTPYWLPVVDLENGLYYYIILWMLVSK